MSNDRSITYVRHWGVAILERNKLAFPCPLDAGMLLDAAFPEYRGTSLIGHNIAQMADTDVAVYSLDKRGAQHTGDCFWVYYDGHRVPLVDENHAFYLPDEVLDDPKFVEWVRNAQVIDAGIDMEKFMLNKLVSVVNTRQELEQVWPELYAACSPIHKMLPGGRSGVGRLASIKRVIDRDIGPDSKNRIMEKIAMGLLLPDTTPKAWLGR